jgi:hypothetical protein
VAVEHAVLNGFPFFGRITADHLAVYENGVPQRMFGSWPITPAEDDQPASSWEFALFGVDWTGRLIHYNANGGVGNAGLLVFEAKQRVIANVSGSSSGEQPVSSLAYTLDLGVGFLTELKRTDADGTPVLTMSLDDHTLSGYYGEAYFVRASDLFDQRWSGGHGVDAGASEGGEVDGVDFELGTHDSGKAWDLLAYVADIKVGCSASDRASYTLVAQSDPNTPVIGAIGRRCETAAVSVGTIGTVQETDELDPAYTVTVAVAGSESTVRLRVAGGLLFTYSVRPSGAALVSVPTWSKGAMFNYVVVRAVDGPHGGSEGSGDGADSSTTKVTAINVGLDADLDANQPTPQYTLASASQQAAVEHAVLNGFPFFGRITADHLAVYENGVPQRMFGSWPIVVDVAARPPPWRFTLFNKDWLGKLVGYNRTGGAGGGDGLLQFEATEQPSTTVTAAAGGGPVASLKFDLDLGAGFLSSLALVDASGVTMLAMKLDSSTVDGYTGDAYFIRAGDLFDHEWFASPDGAIAAAAVVSSSANLSLGAHKSGADWKILAYVAELAAGCDGPATAAFKLVGRTAPDVTVAAMTVGSCTRYSTVGMVPQSSAAVQDLDMAGYTIKASLVGEHSRVRVRVAGGLVKKYFI